MGCGTLGRVWTVMKFASVEWGRCWNVMGWGGIGAGGGGMILSVHSGTRWGWCRVLWDVAERASDYECWRHAVGLCWDGVGAC